MDFFYNNITRVECVVLSSDRSLSTAATRRLQEERVRHCQWPNPGVLSVPQLAKMIFLEAYALGYRELPCPQMISTGDLLRHLSTAPFAFSSLRETWLQYRKLDNIHKIGIQDSQWSSIVATLEQNEDPEIRLSTRALLNVAHLYSQVSSGPISKTEFLSPWQWVNFAIAALRSVGQDFNWIRLLQRPPDLNHEDLLLWLPPHKELYPLEIKFVDELKKFLRIEMPKLEEDPLKTNFDTLPYKNSQENSFIFWTWPSEKARPIENAAFHWHLKKIDMESPNTLQEPMLLRALSLYIDYHEQGTPPLHRLKALPKEQALFSTAKIPSAP